MTTPFDRAALAHVAHLARLSFTAEEEEALAGDLARILATFRSLSEVEGDANEGLPAGTLRADEVAPAPPELADAIVSEFTKRDGRHLQAPRGL